MVAKPATDAIVRPADVLIGFRVEVIATLEGLEQLVSLRFAVGLDQVVVDEPLTDLAIGPRRRESRLGTAVVASKLAFELIALQRGDLSFRGEVVVDQEVSDLRV